MLLKLQNLKGKKEELKKSKLSLKKGPNFLWFTEVKKIPQKIKAIFKVKIIFFFTGLVPQLWPNYTGPELPEAQEVPCDVAQTKCAFRSGCSLALQNYALGCLTLVKGATEVCNSHCRHSLIALMSTVEGQRLMKVSVLCPS